MSPVFSKFDIFGIPVIAAIVILAVSLTGCVRLTDSQGNELTLKYEKLEGFKSFSVNQLAAPSSSVFKAVVKGSIYETGEYMTVFGTCLDGDDNPVNGTYALFNAWYPNGTQFIFNDSMSSIYGSPGYYLHNSVMEAVEGTYLTSMECRIIGDNVTKALAFGEWQNPYWVRRIALLNESISDISVQLENVTLELGNMSFEIGQGFNITWDKIDQINATLTEQYLDLNQSIYYVATVANASVDRNDSYLASLILGFIGNFTQNNSGNSINYEVIREDSVIYSQNWQIKLRAVDSGRIIAFPDSLCYINTTQTPTPTLMSVQGSHWVFNEVVWVWSYGYNVACQFA
jgi:hypothetical protein